MNKLSFVIIPTMLFTNLPIFGNTNTVEDLEAQVATLTEQLQTITTALNSSESGRRLLHGNPSVQKINTYTVEPKTEKKIPTKTTIYKDGYAYTENFKVKSRAVPMTNSVRRLSISQRQKELRAKREASLHSPTQEVTVVFQAGEK